MVMEDMYSPVGRNDIVYGPTPRLHTPPNIEDLAKELRVRDPKTGGEKGKKLAQMGALDPRALMAIAEVAGFGSQKYERYNYARGFDWSLSYDAMQRHLNAFWGGEDLDPESGLPHMAHAGWHAMCLLTFSLRGRGNDDRFPQFAEGGR